ncbi:FHA domain-containing protein [Blastopirellula marina]|uniref:YscD cytoplasmic domain-containing protein n=1 Tax=Blastopirellula marina TaxID=124 RepID=A0A2S8GE42_9BACT|nr:FHA domain-containing protein [Blastopirellula marina]PQO42732.1 hypothetical protein C5Y98_00835 [Blastopirellula marina]PTL46498.1 hypothetical protein C5Y97_00835 [Blastopirellula marina]
MGRDSLQNASSRDQVNPGQGRRAELLITRGQASFRVRHIDSSVFMLGSSSECDLVLGDEQFPELYAYLLRTDEGYQLRCLAVEPVLTVNSEDTLVARLEDGDRIRCGPYEFRFHQTAASPDRPAEAAKVLPTAPAKADWVATDGQGREGVAAVRRLLHDIQTKVGNPDWQTSQHRRSA